MARVEVPFLVGALLLATWREVRRQGVAVLNPHWIVPAGLVALAVRAVTGVPYVVTVHGADAHTLRGGSDAWPSAWCCGGRRGSSR